jgi:hypothetical protein
MSATKRTAIVGVLVVGFAVLVAFGGSLLGARAGVAIMVAAFVTGFAWLWLLVAPWALEGRAKRSETPRT